MIDNITSSGNSNCRRTVRIIFAHHIGPEDHLLLLKSGQFEGIDHIEYNKKSGYLDFGKHKYSTTSFMLFEEWREYNQPEWFTSNEWQQYQAYREQIEDVDSERIRLLMYNEHLGQAFYVDYLRYGAGVGKIGSLEY